MPGKMGQVFLAELASTWWVLFTAWVYQNSKNSCDLVNSLPHSSKKNRWSEADKSEFTTLDGYFLWDSPQLQKLRQQCPILEGKNTKTLSNKKPRGRNSCKRNSGPLPVPLRFISFFLSSLDLCRWQGFEWTFRTDRTYGPNNFWSCKRQGPSIVHICAIFQSLNLHTRLTWIEQSQTPQSLPPKHLLQRNLLSLARKWKSVVICQQYLVSPGNWR